MAHTYLEVMLTSGRLTDQDELIKMAHTYLEVMLTSGRLTDQDELHQGGSYLP